MKRREFLKLATLGAGKLMLGAAALNSLAAMSILGAAKIDSVVNRRDKVGNQKGELPKVAKVVQYIKQNKGIDILYEALEDKKEVTEQYILGSSLALSSIPNTLLRKFKLDKAFIRQPNVDKDPQGVIVHGRSSPIDSEGIVDILILANVNKEMALFQAASTVSHELTHRFAATYPLNDPISTIAKGALGIYLSKESIFSDEDINIWDKLSKDAGGYKGETVIASGFTSLNPFFILDSDPNSIYRYGATNIHEDIACAGEFVIGSIALGYNPYELLQTSRYTQKDAVLSEKISIFCTAYSRALRECPVEELDERCNLFLQQVDHYNGRTTSSSLRRTA